MIRNTGGSGNLITTTEIRRKRRAKKRTGPYWFVIILLLIGIVLVSLFSPFFDVQTIVVEGNHKIMPETLVNISTVAKGTNIFRINKQRAERNILNMPYVESVEIIRKFPNTVVIQIEERKPVGYIPFMGSKICIDQKGNVLEVISSDIESEQLPLPIITGLKFNEFKLGEPLKIDDIDKFNVILSCVKEIMNHDLLGKISEINIYDINNIKMTIHDQFEVLLGDSQKLNYKFSFLEEILNRLGDEKGIIDLTNGERASFIPGL